MTKKKTASKKIGFKKLEEKIAQKYVGKKVAPKYQKEYGKRYSKKEAIEVGAKVAAKVKKEKEAKIARGGEINSDKKRYAITNEVYPPRYSVIELIGEHGSYSHVKSFSTKKDAVKYAEENGIIENASYKFARGGNVQPEGSSPKFTTGDKVYSYQNPDYPAEVIFVRKDKKYEDRDNREVVFYYKVLLKDKDGYTRSSKWMAEDGMSKTKQETYAEGGTMDQHCDAKVVGHTESGKPVYDEWNDSVYDTYSEQDHLDAAKRMGQLAEEEAEKGGEDWHVGFLKYNNIALRHYDAHYGTDTAGGYAGGGVVKISGLPSDVYQALRSINVRLVDGNLQVDKLGDESFEIKGGGFETMVDSRDTDKEKIVYDYLANHYSYGGKIKRDDEARSRQMLLLHVKDVNHGKVPEEIENMNNDEIQEYLHDKGYGKYADGGAIDEMVVDEVVPEKQGPVEDSRITNSEAHIYAENRMPFQGKSLEGKEIGNGNYLVLSLGFYPLWFYCAGEEKWYQNRNMLTMVNAIHLSQSRPTWNAEVLDDKELDQKIIQDISKFDLGGLAVQQLYPMTVDNTLIAHSGAANTEL